MATAQKKWNVTIQDLVGLIGKAPAGAQMTPREATLAIAIMERLETIDGSLAALRDEIRNQAIRSKL